METATRRVLAAGALAGLALSATTIVDPASVMPPRDDVVAMVGDHAITDAALAAAAARLGAAREDPQTRRRLVDYLVDEQLLVRRARDLGLERSDPAVRKILVARMIDRVVAGEAGGAESAGARVAPTEADLRAYFESNRDRFLTPARARVRRIRFSGARRGAAERARAAHERLAAGEPFEHVREALGDDEVVAVPDGLLTPAVLRRYLGADAVEAVQELSPGERTEPVAAGRSYSIVELVELQAAAEPTFAEVEASVRALHARALGEQALRGYLAALRAETPVLKSDRESPERARASDDG